jgi:hypothetical protein
MSVVLLQQSKPRLNTPVPLHRAGLYVAELQVVRTDQQVDTAILQLTVK